jgi:hypothetical protein
MLPHSGAHAGGNLSSSGIRWYFFSNESFSPVLHEILGFRLDNITVISRRIFCTVMGIGL